jgi:pimeloyl-ACP methyl ester carboxylesterase
VRAEERAALAVAAGRAFSDVVGVVEGMHRAVLRRAYRLLGGPGRAPRRVHEGFTAGIYASVRGSGDLVTYGASQLVAARADAGAEALMEARAGAQWSAVLCSAFGDHLDAANSPLAMTMSVRRDGRAVALTPGSLAAAFPDAKSGIVLFIHGLGLTEHAWGSAVEDGERDRGYAHRLAADLGLTPVYLRYNAGLHISANGRLLAALLNQMVRHWPTTVTRLVLVGHSMGGLVARSACHVGHQGAAGWVPLVSDVVALGSPHHGAPLERVANRTALALRLVPESRPLAGLLDRRSAGIKDLRFGYLTDQTWQGLPSDATWDESDDVPLLPASRHHFVAGTVCRRADAWIADLVGDLMVLPNSATGRASTPNRRSFPVEAGHRIGGVNHHALLGHPHVYRVLRGRLEATRDAAVERAGGRRS